MTDKTITIEAMIDAPLADVWAGYSSPEAITQWNFASDDWCCPSADVDLRPGGRLTSRMEAKDGSMGFDFGGTYEEVTPKEALSVRLDDGRLYRTTFRAEGDRTHVTTVFDPETMNPAEMQRAGWQAILDSFKAYMERKTG